VASSVQNDLLASRLDETLLDCLPAGVYVCDLPGAIRYYNQRAVELWGREPRPHDTHELFFRPFKFYDANRRRLTSAQTPMAEALQSGEPQRNRELLIERPDGSRISMLVSVDPIKDERNGLLGAVSVFQNAAPAGSAGGPQAIGEFLSDVVCTAQVSERGVVELESVSDQFTGLTGYTMEELEERGGVAFVIYPDDMLVALQSLGRVLAGSQERNEIRMICKDGAVRWMRYLAQPTWDTAAGRVVRIQAFAQDITERKQAGHAVQESERRFRQLAEHINEVFWLSDPPRTQLLYVSPTYEKIWGRSCQSLYERPLSFLDAIHAADRERVLATLEQHARGESTSTEYRVLRPDGSLRWVRDRGFPIRDDAGHVYRVAGVAEDITQAKIDQEALKEADRRKDEFLATLAHELRNPLAPVRNALQIMRLAGGNAETVRQAQDMMERQIQQMVRLVDDLLDVSRISRGKIELRKERVELAAVVRNALETSRPLLEQSRQHLNVTLPAGPVPLDADPVRLAQVLANLLNNSAKYTEEGGQVWLTAERQGPEVVISVRDNGIGIPADMLPHIFDMFTQVDRSIGRSQGGLGIGLTLVKTLVEMHGGSVVAHSDGPGRGSAFTVRLPFRADLSADDTPGPEHRAQAPSGGRRILIVDDNHDAAESLGTVLRLMNNEVHIAPDGLSALQAADVFRPDLVFLDIGMPGMDGYEVARRLRQRPAFQNTVLVALTGWGQEEDRRQTQQAGFDHHLVKPVEPGALQELMADMKKQP
jgi:PAS domain S-box-containing protein